MYTFFQEHEIGARTLLKLQRMFLYHHKVQKDSKFLTNSPAGYFFVSRSLSPRFFHSNSQCKYEKLLFTHKWPKQSKNNNGRRFSLFLLRVRQKYILRKKYGWWLLLEYSFYVMFLNNNNNYFLDRMNYILEFYKKCCKKFDFCKHFLKNVQLYGLEVWFSWCFL